MKPLARSWVSLGAFTSLSQAIGFVLLPVMTRLYAPGDFGTFSIYLGWVAPLAALGLFGVESLVPSARSEVVRRAIFSVSARVAGGVALIGAAISWRSWDSSHHLMVAAVALGAFLLAMQSLMTAYAIREGAFVRLGCARLILSGLLPIVQVVAALVVGASDAALICSHLVILVASCACLFPAMRSTGRGYAASIFFGRRIGSATRRLFRYCWKVGLSGALNQFTLCSPIIYAGLVFQSAEVGDLSLAFRVYGAITALFGVTLAHGFWAQSSSHFRARTAIQEQRNLMVAWSKLAVPVATGLAVGIWLVGVRGFETVFGSHWGNSYWLSVLLIPYLFVEVAIIPILQILKVHGAYGVLLRAAAIRGLLVVALYAIAFAAAWPLTWVASGFAILMLATYSIQFLDVARLFKGGMLDAKQGTWR